MKKFIEAGPRSKGWGIVMFIIAGWLGFSTALNLAAGVFNIWILVNILFIVYSFYRGRYHIGWGLAEETKVAIARIEPMEMPPAVESILKSWLYGTVPTVHSDGSWHLEEDAIIDLYKAAGLLDEYNKEAGYDVPQV